MPHGIDSLLRILTLPLLSRILLLVIPQFVYHLFYNMHRLVISSRLKNRFEELRLQN